MCEMAVPIAVNGCQCLFDGKMILLNDIWKNNVGQNDFRHKEKHNIDGTKYDQDLIGTRQKQNDNQQNVSGTSSLCWNLLE